MRVLGAIRSLNHLGWAAGAAFGALIIGIDSRPGYVGLLALDAASFLAYAVAIAGVPRVAPVARSERGPRLMVLRDRPYVSLAAMMGVLSLCWGMLSSGVPLWVALHTDAPRPVSAVIVLLNSLAIAAFQVRVSTGIRSPLGAARGAIWAGSALAASCLVFALTDGPRRHGRRRAPAGRRRAARGRRAAVRGRLVGALDPAHAAGRGRPVPGHVRHRRGDRADARPGADDDAGGGLGAAGLARARGAVRGGDGAGAAGHALGALDPARAQRRSAGRDDPVLVDEERWRLVSVPAGPGGCRGVAGGMQPRRFAAGRLGFQRGEDPLARRVGRRRALEPRHSGHALATRGDDRGVHASRVERGQQLVLLERARVAGVAQALELVVALALGAGQADHVDHRHRPAGPRHARHLRGGPRRLVDVVEREAADHDVELLAGERQRGRVALDEDHVAATGGHAGSEHLPRQVDHHGERCAGGQMAPHVPRPAGDVEHHVIRTDRDVRGDPLEHLAVAEERVGALELAHLAGELAARDVAVLHPGQGSGVPTRRRSGSATAAACRRSPRSWRAARPCPRAWRPGGRRRRRTPGR